MDNIGAAVAQGILNGLWGAFVNNLVPIAIFSGVLALIFLAVRELFTWYWKVNRIVALLEQIEANTRKSEVFQGNLKVQKVDSVPAEPQRPPMGN